ncbi:unnamed protein product [Rotaria magnacalcarata]|uniref:EF-hand domain-containing protein n=5 Tax=Rotaria magnacalcarata TaxID=392030 RepID=A0A816M0I7_9BILA|nr:unnamed protein product [Rotaria magnacalcarata]CAF2136538.1 unnamed protein product [Rotaria magnacalcarata]CAF3797322.1 unnamed protein product [Rotaria magnacalcarata]CAF3846623.1 unnamed protein product [Rotaria magnacalcarata]
MFNLLGDHLFEDVVTRVEQSRVAYNSQAEDFRDLNGSLQAYLKDIKKIDHENRLLQDNIEQIRTNYILTLDNHLKRLPQDFREHSHKLTEAHIERYKSKSQARRFINEREELKKRINFVSSNEKEQIKRINNLQRHQNLVQKELKSLNEQLQHLYGFVENEKQQHLQAMSKVDELQIQLEHICIQRSKAEFEIQTLREELKLMQTSKEFLDDEHQMILSTQAEANEYLLSCLNESITRISEDFNELNKAQIKQVENEYKHMMTVAKENSLANANKNETMANHQRAAQIEYEKLQDEHRCMTQELTIVTDHNLVLTEQILAMEADLFSIRDERMKELTVKDNELERSKIELQSLNEKLNHLAEYDRNLKFELTLYRGVLEGEYRRKQQQLINNQYPIRPTTLKTTVTQSNKTSSLLNNRNEVEIDFETTSAELDQILSAKSKFKKENIESDHQESSLQEETIDPTNLPLRTSIEKSGSPIIVPAPSDRSSPYTPQAHFSPTQFDNQQASVDAWQSPSSAAGVQVYLITATQNEPTSIANVLPFLTEVYRPPPVRLETSQQFPNAAELSSVSVLTDQEMSLNAQLSSLTSDDEQDPSKKNPSAVAQFEDHEQSFDDYESSSTLLKEVEALSKFSMMGEQKFSDTQKSPTISTNTTVSNDQSPSKSLENQEITSDFEQPERIETPQQNASNELNSEEQASTITEEQPISSEIQQDSTTDDTVNEQPFREISDGYEIVTVELPSPIAEDDEKSNASLNETNENHQSSGSTESLTIEEHDVHKVEQQEMPSLNAPTTSLEEIKAEEPTSFSDQHKIEENSKIHFISSPGYYGTTINNEEFNDQPLFKTLLYDVESDNIDSTKDVDASSLKSEDKKSQDYDESHLEAVVQDLRYIYCQFANDEDLLEINDAFPEKLIDRLEFGDNLIRILFDGLLRKYLVQPAKEEIRSKTLDWIEFRDILFPILTGRYTEQHIRKLFDLLDLRKDGYLSLVQIVELLELLQINNTDELTSNMINKLNKNENDKINFDELIETIKEIDDAKTNILSEEIESKPWYMRRVVDEENHDSKSISFEVPNVIFPIKINDDVLEMINNGIMLLRRIFKRVGADIETKQLDSNKPALSMKLTNEFIHNNVHISSDDLEAFIELYLNRKRNSDVFINWVEFRDLCLPFVIGGNFVKEDIERWFNVFDDKEQRIIIPEQVLHLLRLLQVPNPDKILKKMVELSDTYTNNNNNSWTLGELIFALDNIDEMTARILPSNQPILSYDLNWFNKI